MHGLVILTHHPNTTNLHKVLSSFSLLQKFFADEQEDGNMAFTLAALVLFVASGRLRIEIKKRYQFLRRSKCMQAFLCGTESCM